MVAGLLVGDRAPRDAMNATLFYNMVHYAVRPWPWILVALASLLVYPELADIQRAFPDLPPALLGHDIAYPAMLRFLPVGFVGLMVGGLIAANSSTILTHLNWGASYLVHDFYRRFVRRDADEAHYVLVGRLVTVGLFVVSSGLVFVLDTAKDAFDIILQVGAGTGLLYLVRWFWWRVTAWSEVVAMVTSFLASVVVLVLNKNGMPVSTHAALVGTAAFTTVCWVLTAYLGPQTDRRVLVDFYRMVRPAGPGWEPIRMETGLPRGASTHDADNIPLALVGWVSGCITIWTALFTVGSVLYGLYGQALVLGAVFAVSGFVLLRVTGRLWSSESAAEA